jgi:hypothetical protein
MTVIVKDSVSVLPAPSVAVQLTVVGPTMNNVPEPLVQLMLGVTPLLSVAVGAS